MKRRQNNGGSNFKRRRYNGGNRNVGMNRLNITPWGRGQVETKFVYDTISYTELASTGALTHLTPIDQGSDNTDDRVGTKVTAKWLHLYLHLDNSKLEVSTSATWQTYRVIIFSDLNNTGTIPSAADLMYSQTPLGCFGNRFRDRFKILYDKGGVLGPSGSGSSDPHKYFKITFPLKNLQVRFTGTTGASYGPGCIFLYVDVHATGDTDQKTEYAYESCISFTDE